MGNLRKLRDAIRSGDYIDSTSGLMPDLVQGNLVIMPKVFADEFVEFCQKNPKPCPLLGVSKPGDSAIPNLGKSLDIRHDLPEYHVFKHGDFFTSTPNVQQYWADDSVAMVIGCSFSFENALLAANLPVKNISLGVNVSMYDTNIAMNGTKNFNCNMVVSMRPYKKQDIDEVVRITSEFPNAHGAPIHIGSPESIGIMNIDQPDYGSAVPINDDEVPVFWGCGVTTQAAVRSAKLPLVMTHAPGKMLITDFTYKDLKVMDC